MPEAFHSYAAYFDLYGIVPSCILSVASSDLLRSGTKAPVPVQLDEILVPLG